MTSSWHWLTLIDSEMYIEQDMRVYVYSDAAVFVYLKGYKYITLSCFDNTEQAKIECEKALS